MKPTFLNALLCCLGVFAGVLAIELSSRLYLFLREDLDGVDSADLFDTVPDPQLGYVQKRNSSHRATKLRKDGSVCYDVVYSTDGAGRRVVMQPPASLEKYIVLFGCSVAFGEGLRDQETLQHILFEKLPDREVFNYALHGWGPSHMLRLLKMGELKEQLPMTGGEALYISIPEHVSRVRPDTRAWWLLKWNGPYFFLAEDGILRDGGSFRENPTVAADSYLAFTEFRNRFSFLSLLELNYPFALHENDFDLLLAVIEESASRYRADTNGSFRAVLHPLWSGGKREHYRYFIRGLEERKIDFLDYSRMGFKLENMIGGGCDPHPNAQFNERLASAIASDIR